MRDIVVFGIGNTLRGDDGIGAVILNNLQRLVTDPRITCVVCHQITPEHAELILTADLVVFIDADCKLSPGGWTFTDIFADESMNPANYHSMQPRDLLTLAHTLSHGLCQAILVSIGPGQFDLPDTLSEPVTAAIDEITERLASMLESHLTSDIA